MAPTIVFIAGANRGLGLGLAKGLTAKRHLSGCLQATYEEGIKQSAFDAAKEATNYDIRHLDIIIANTGIAKLYPLVHSSRTSSGPIYDHIDVNVLSAMSLYHARRDMLQKSTRKPIYAIMGSGVGGLATKCGTWKIQVYR
ncbi:Short-chain dehydrogenase/reductase SDR [Penicillium cf. griseofulvum]|uniref:Short-chain dehydrogenase/reductase SDR n=1 Tax=Penicillium cf. griseofulvum TaxID=2972120 RepID=A0A9W9MTL4_9EURO|nr:Short-chain dehydrogenase/reductase SDR [Penicillium cf. griseofulvum]KAJ5446142.1 Short-chain dehydrogenase/reductase SDR [Penicillium cf. griseofulvum]KAJ5447883.1 Short-chain dehydrogenase/reductase SDR [Penicillium cf. griseofulvum]